jgi:hypothetical protein
MSDGIVNDTTPTSTSDAAEAVIDSYESADEGNGGIGSSGGAPEVVQAAAEAPAAEAITPQELSEVEKLLHEEGFKEPRREDGRENRIPYSKVKKIIENGLKKGRTEWDTTRTTIEQERDTFRQQVEQLSALGELMDRDPEAFLNLVAQHDTRYQRYLTPQEAAQQAQQQADAEMPQPDVALPDGSRTYSLQGIQKLLDWNTQRTIQQANKTVEERLKPITEREKQEQLRIQGDQAMQQVRQRTQQQIADAQQWPGFKDHEDAILKALQEDSAKAKAEGRRPTLSLEGAYRQVVIPRLSTDRNKMREELLKELNAAPKATSVARSGHEAPRGGGMTSTADIAARTLARLEGRTK